MSNKSDFLGMVVKAGIKETKRKLRKHLMRRDEPVDLEKELQDTLGEIGNNAEVQRMGITHDDLREVIKKVAAAHGLQVQLSDGTVVTPEPDEKMSLMDRAASFVMSKAAPSSRGVVYDGIKAVLRSQAQSDIKSGKVTVPVDVEGYARRLMSNTRHIPRLKLSFGDYVDIIREICEEFSLEVKEG